MNMNDDADPAETDEWLDALKAVELHRGHERANVLVNHLVDQARRDGLYIPRSLTTAYKNTIPPEQEVKAPGDRAIEHRLRSIRPASYLLAYPGLQIEPRADGMAPQCLRFRFGCVAELLDQL